MNEIQDLLLTGHALTITKNGIPTIIDLSPYLDNTDAQDLSLDTETNTLSLTGDETTVDLSGYEQDLVNVLSEGSSAGDVNISDLADPVNAQDAATKAYVDVLRQQITALEDRINNIVLQKMSADAGKMVLW